MKANKKLLISAMALGLAGLTTVGSTYAWFSMNKVVNAENLQVKATTPASLVISNSTNMSDNKTSIKFGDTSSNVLTPSTHDETVGKTTKLKYVRNSEDVDPKTGLALDGKTLEFSDAVNTTTILYYVDYTCYVASSGSELSKQDLKVSLYTSAEVAKDTFKAISVDFYVADANTDSIGSYVSTLNLSTLNDSFESKTPATILTDGTIPMANGKTNFIRIDMRVYYDGALEKSSDTTYVRNDGVDTSLVTFGVKFTLSDHA